ncbi:SDR family oxidoreductase [Streptomyces sp. NPDC101150]|uniref:SDR family oxidoreductase n=1 Tax=Streptomyces sp. NPDC101150 TaxID=3366114 RepID=UPI0038294179
MTASTDMKAMTSAADRTAIAPFRGRVAMITGGGSGIGRATALRYARGGGTVIVCGRRPEPLAETAELIRGAGGQAGTFSLDVRDADEVRRVVDEIRGRHGRIDALVNNAAGNFVAPAEKLSANGWRAVIDIVLNGTFYCTRAAADVMLEQGSGSVLSVIASYAWTGHPGTVHSAAAKAGVLAMTRTLAAEWASRGVRLNCMAPGPTATEGAGQALWPDGDSHRRVVDSVPAGRFASPEEIADIAAFLLEDRSAYITGEVLTADGGQWLGRQVYGAPLGREG